MEFVLPQVIRHKRLLNIITFDKSTKTLQSHTRSPWRWISFTFWPCTQDCLSGWTYSWIYSFFRQLLTFQLAQLTSRWIIVFWLLFSDCYVTYSGRLIIGRLIFIQFWTCKHFAKATVLVDLAFVQYKALLFYRSLNIGLESLFEHWFY